ncbi:hypothetical protein K4F52_001064 [Lecanicillium sp. MT-2017a]|nr:hypothetical protein K4F52_001064 [Lecanicillium sp. MT-2017a]
MSAVSPRANSMKGALPIDQGDAGGQEDTGKTSVQSPFKLPSVSLPKGGGAIKGIGEKFSVSPATGTGNFSVPIATSRGRGDSSIKLELSYNSGSGNGPFGLGWQISSQSIVRKTDKGLPQYNGEQEDEFMLSGTEDLVPVQNMAVDGAVGEGCEFRTQNGVRWQVVRYQPRVESGFLRILRLCNVQTGQSYWEVKTDSNVTTVFGEDSNSRVVDPQQPLRVFEWLPSRTYDDKGNQTIYEYKKEDCSGFEGAGANATQYDGDEARLSARYIKRIKYGNTVSRLSPQFKSQNDWLLEVVFDYGDHDEASPVPRETRPWALRNDPFSSRRAGFDIRMYRLCYRILMFHHFDDEPGVGRDCVVSSFNIDYEHVGKESGGLAIASLISSVKQEYWKRFEDGYKRDSLPPLEFTYSRAQPAKRSLALESSSLLNLPAGLTDDYQLVDLEGQGLPGVVLRIDGSLQYMPNNGNGKLGLASAFPSNPTAVLRQGTEQWMDLDGSGKIELVQMSGVTPGFYKRNWDQRSEWDSFRAFDSFPTLNLNDKHVKFIDLTGDGIADIVICQDELLTSYRGLGDEGFGIPSYHPTPVDVASGSQLVFWDGVDAIFTADMTGDGLTDLVRICNSKVSYWPSLGYGKFDKMVTMTNSPVFDYPDMFDQAHLRLSDIDGSGTTDIIYLGGEVPTMYHNLSGNGWSSGTPIVAFPGINSTTNVQVADLLGRGTACLVWSSSLPGDFGSQIRYLDLMEAGKPYLLVGMVNNMGWETRLTYESSTQFYARDKEAGRPWTAHLPFPVQCVERSELVDKVSKALFTTRYAYHDGYFDGTEREFRGFGMVESWDTEVYESLRDGGYSNISKRSNLPPVLTKSWYHTGQYLNGELITKYPDVPFWCEDKTALPFLRSVSLPDSIAAKGGAISYVADHGERLEACRALRGQMIRTEIYALDGSELQHLPYQVKESNMQIELRQSRGQNKHAVFFVRPRESVEVVYDRKKYGSRFDPRVVHTLTLETDFYGNPLSSVVVSYGRRHDDPDCRLHAQDREAQRTTYAVLSTNMSTNDIDTTDTYLLPRPAQSQVYEIINISACQPSTGRILLFEDVRQVVKHLSSGKCDLPFENYIGPYPSSNKIYRRLLKESQKVYRRDDLKGPLAVGAIESLGLPWKNFQLVLADDQAESYVTAGKIPPEQLYHTLEDQCNFIRLPGRQGWWAPSGEAFFSPSRHSTAEEELQEAREHFFVIRRSRSQFDRQESQSESFYDYDKYDLLLEEARDPYGSRVTAGERNKDPSLPLVKSGNDYRILSPFLSMDSNRNRSEVAFDLLGNVVASAAMGKPEEDLGDSLRGVKTDLEYVEVAQFFDAPIKHSMKLIGTATTRTVYDFFSYYRTRHHKHPQPNWAASLSRETHNSDLPKGAQTRVFVAFAYADGRGRSVQTKSQCEPGPLTVSAEAAVVGSQVQSALTRWHTSSWVIMNNKNKPVRQYEPFFSDTHKFQDEAIHGVSKIMLYDALARPIAALSPNHTWTKTTFDPWSSEEWDRQDTMLIPDPASDDDIGPFVKLLPRGDYMPTWYAQRRDGQLGNLEKVAAVKSSLSANTPTTKFYDSLGRVCVAFDTLRGTVAGEEGPDEILRQPSFLDVQGFSEKTVDALGRTVGRNAYSIGGWVIAESNMDSGTKWSLPDAIGGPILTWNARGDRFRTEYDRSRRVIGLYIMQGGKESLVEKSIFGEIQPDVDQYNARGRIILAFDQSGVTKTPYYNFKGNLQQSSRQLASEYKETIDWTEHVPLEPDTYEERVSFDALGKPTKTVLPDGTVTLYRYNERGLTRSVETTVPGGVACDVITDIEYDAKGQHPNDYNNRLSHTTLGNLTEKYRYDSPERERGHMTSMPGLCCMTYDYAERMASSVQTVSKIEASAETTYYRYDTTGKRVRKVVERPRHVATPYKETIYVGGAFEVFKRYTPLKDVSVKVNTVHIIESGRQLLLIENSATEEDASTALYRYQLGNFQGSASVELDQDAQILSYEEFTPYGVSTVKSIYRETEVPKRYRFLGKERDDTGLYHFGLRYYAAWLGRFISADPKGAIDGSNLYQYSHGNPNTLADPGGTAATPAPKPSLESLGWTDEVIRSRARDWIVFENLPSWVSGLQEWRIYGRLAAGDFAHMLQRNYIATGNAAADVAAQFEQYLPHKTTGRVGSSFIDFMFPALKEAYEHKLIDFEKYSENGKLIASKVVDAFEGADGIIAQLEKHTANIASNLGAGWKTQLAVTIRGVERTEPGWGQITAEINRIMAKAGQLEPLFANIKDSGLRAAGGRLDAAAMAFINKAGGLAKYVGKGARVLGPLAVGASVVLAPFQAHAALDANETAGNRTQAGLDLGSGVTGIGVAAIATKSAAITATGGATAAAAAGVVVAGAALGGAAAGAALGSYVAEEVENTEWAQKHLGETGAAVAGASTGVLAGAAAGAAVGALVGSALPVVGTLAGAAIGGAAGALGAGAKILINKYWP